MIFKGKEHKDKVIAYKHVFGSQFGKEVLFDLMNKYHILNSHKGDPYMEGQRSVVLDILYMTNVNLQELDKLLKAE